MNGYDYEGPEIVEFPRRTHVATREFGCVECLTRIQPGQRYEVRPLLVDREFRTERMHYLGKDCSREEVTQC